MQDKIKKLIAILKEEDVDEIEVRHFFTSVRVSRRRRVAAADPMKSGETAPERINAAADTERRSDRTGIPEVAQFQPAGEILPETPEGKAANKYKEIASPMVGTFYRSSDPGSEPFVYEGKRIEEGDIICIIESMKLMNEIEAEMGGILREVLVEDAQPVEYGQPLFLVESA